ncbi:MAG: hypothetical protein ABIB71_00765 [Candidatus Woesearchaeota archaeon]
MKWIFLYLTFLVLACSLASAISIDEIKPDYQVGDLTLYDKSNGTDGFGHTLYNFWYYDSTFTSEPCRRMVLAEDMVFHHDSTCISRNFFVNIEDRHETLEELKNTFSSRSNMGEGRCSSGGTAYADGSKEVDIAICVYPGSDFSIEYSFYYDPFLISISGSNNQRDWGVIDPIIKELYKNIVSKFDDSLLYSDAIDFLSPCEIEYLYNSPHYGSNCGEEYCTGGCARYFLGDGDCDTSCYNSDFRKSVFRHNSFSLLN